MDRRSNRIDRSIAVFILAIASGLDFDRFGPVQQAVDSPLVKIKRLFGDVLDVCLECVKDAFIGFGVSCDVDRGCLCSAGFHKSGVCVGLGVMLV